MALAMNTTSLRVARPLLSKSPISQEAPRVSRSESTRVGRAPWRGSVASPEPTARARRLCRARGQRGGRGGADAARAGRDRGTLGDRDAAVFSAHRDGVGGDACESAVGQAPVRRQPWGKQPRAKRERASLPVMMHRPSPVLDGSLDDPRTGAAGGPGSLTLCTICPIHGQRSGGRAAYRQLRLLAARYRMCRGLRLRLARGPAEPSGAGCGGNEHGGDAPDDEPPEGPVAPVGAHLQRHPAPPSLGLSHTPAIPRRLTTAGGRKGSLMHRTSTADCLPSGAGHTVHERG